MIRENPALVEGSSRTALDGSRREAGAESVRVPAPWTGIASWLGASEAAQSCCCLGLGLGLGIGFGFGLGIGLGSEPNPNLHAVAERPGRNAADLVVLGDGLERVGLAQGVQPLPRRLLIGQAHRLREVLEVAWLGSALGLGLGLGLGSGLGVG